MASRQLFTLVPLLPDFFFNLCGMFITMHVPWLIRDSSVPFGSAGFSHLGRLLRSIRGGRLWRQLLFGHLRAIVVLLSSLFPLVILRGSWSRFRWSMWGFIIIIFILVRMMGTLAILVSLTGTRSGLGCRCVQLLNWRLITSPTGHWLSLISEPSIWPLSR